MFPVSTPPHQGAKNEYPSNEINTIKFVEPRLLKDKCLPEVTKRFVMKAPLSRMTILGLALYASRQLKSGMSLLDVGAGDCPYKGIFAHVMYKCTDFGKTGHKYKEIDYFCTADNISVPEKSFDAILSTEVLEHIPEPKKVLAEFNRVLKNDGHLFMTTPFMHPVHEPPFDFFRYTPYALSNLLQEAGFEVVFIVSRGGMIVSLADTFRKKYRPLRPPRNIKGFFIYCFMFLPIFSFPILAMRLLPFKLFAWLDKNLDRDQIYTPGYALHAIKIKEL